MAEFKHPTDHEFAAISKRTSARMKRRFLAVSAHYDRQEERVMITLNTGAVVGFPLSVLQGLEHATEDDLREIAIEGGGYGLHVAALDADISVPALLVDQLGSPIMMRALTRAKASKANGQRGGRPRKSKAA